MTTVIEQINQKIDKIMEKIQSWDKILEKVETMDIRLIDLEIMIKTIENEIKNKSKSSKRNKALIKARNEELIKIDNNHYQPGSYDEWIMKTQLPLLKELKKNK